MALENIYKGTSRMYYLTVSDLPADVHLSDADVDIVAEFYIPNPRNAAAAPLATVTLTKKELIPAENYVKNEDDTPAQDEEGNYIIEEGESCDEYICVVDTAQLVAGTLRAKISVSYPDVQTGKIITDVDAFNTGDIIAIN